MDTSPVTLDELRMKFKLTLGVMKRGTKIEYTVVKLNNQFKITGIITLPPDVSTFTIDLTPDIPRRFIDADLLSLVYAIKDRFYKFQRNSYKYTTPFENHISQTVFYFMAQLNFRVLDTVSYITQAHANLHQQKDPSLSFQQENPFQHPKEQQPKSMQLLIPQPDISQPDTYLHMPPPHLPHLALLT